MNATPRNRDRSPQSGMRSWQTSGVVVSTERGQEVFAMGEVFCRCL